jgi:hypothetical protein
MTAGWSTYPYLVANALNVCLVLLAAWWLLRPNERATVLWMGAIYALPFPFSWLLEGTYWNPARMGGGAFGIEDALCSFHLGAVVWLVALLLGRGRVMVPAAPRPRFGRIAGVTACVIACFLALWGAGVDAMTALILVQALVLLALGIVCRRLWRLAVATALVYPLVYASVVTVYFHIWPHFDASWMTAAPWGVRVAGLPLGEIVWVVEFSAAWPLYAGYLFDVRLRERVA